MIIFILQQLKKTYFFLQNKLKVLKQQGKFLYTMGTPSIQDLKTVITMNLEKDNKIALKDIDIAEKSLWA